MRRETFLLLTRTGLVLVFIVGWEAIGRSGLISSLILAPPSAIPAALIDAASHNELALASYQTLIGILASFVIATVAGTAVGMLAGVYLRAGRTAEPLIYAFFAFPLVVLYPVFLLAFGFGPAASIAFAALTGFVPISVNTMVGLRSVSPSLITAAHSMGANRMSIIRKISIPSSLPTFVSGIRQGLAFCIAGELIGEVLAPVGGLGQIIVVASSTFNAAMYEGVVVIVIIIAATLNELTRVIERRFERWRHVHEVSLVAY